MNSTDTRTFEELECWKACRALRIWVRKSVVSELSSEEKFLLKDQLVRASRSTTANIAEGHGRFHFLDNAKFCRNSRGSCFEVLDHLITAQDEEYINEETVVAGRERINAAVRLLNGYVAYLNRSAKESKS